MTVNNPIINYPAFDQDDKQFSGIFSIEAISQESVVIINDVSYTVKGCSLLEITLFPASGALKISDNRNTYRSDSAIRTILKCFGFSDKQTFLKHFFNKPVINGSQAIITLWAIKFKPNMYI